MFDRRIILGVPVDNLTMDTTLERILSVLEDKNNLSQHYIATVNVDFIVNTLTWSFNKISDVLLYTILKSSFLITADGMPLVWGSRLLGNRIQGRVTGSDLIPTLASFCAKKNKSIFLLGGREEVNQKAMEILLKNNPELKIAGSYSSIITIDKMDPLKIEKLDEQIIQKINTSGADILLIALGNPKQEYWYYKNAKNLKVKVSIGIGGTLDFISGNIKRAPKWMQKTGLEWVFRFLQEPSRMWKRYTRDIALFLGLIIFPILYYQFRKNLLFGENTKVEIKIEDRVINIELPRNLNESVTEIISQNIKNTNPEKIIFDFSKVKLIDNLSLAYLFHIVTTKNNPQITIEFRNVNSIVQKFFLFNRLMPEFREQIIK